MARSSAAATMARSRRHHSSPPCGPRIASPALSTIARLITRPAAAASSSHRRRWCRQLSAPADLGMPATSGTGEWTARSCNNPSPDLVLQ